MYDRWVNFFFALHAVSNMSTFRLRLLPTALLALGFAATAQAQSLVQVYEAARAYDAEYQAAKSEADASRAKVDQSRALLLPTVGLGADYKRNETDTRNPSSDSTNKQRGVGLSASIPIIDVANWKSRERAVKSLDLVDIQLRAAEQDLMVRTSQAYFDLLAARDAHHLARSQKAAMAQQLAYAKRNFEVGTATITDSREAQAGYDLAVAQESAAAFEEQTKYTALLKLVGQESIAPWALAEPFVPPQLEDENPQYWLDLADQSDAVQAQRTQYEMAKLDTEGARAGHLPTLSGSLGVNEGRSSPNSVPGLSGSTRSTNKSAGLSLSVPLFAGFAIQNQVREKVALEDKARSDLLATERDMAQSTREAYFGVQSLKAQVHALEAAVKSSESALEANKLGYEVGVRINLDVLNAQTQHFDTQNKLSKARYDLLTTQLKLKQAVGTLTQTDLEKVNTYLRPTGAQAAAPAAQLSKAEKTAAAESKAAAEKAAAEKAKAE